MIDVFMPRYFPRFLRWSVYFPVVSHEVYNHFSSYIMYYQITSQKTSANKPY